MLGRRRPTRNNLDALFALPTAAITLQTAAGFEPTGVGAVCYREAEGSAFAQTQADIVQLLDNDEDPDLERTTDQFGFTWLVARQDDMSALVTDLHAINTGLEAQGFGPSLLCSMVGFKDAVRPRARAGLPLQAGHVLPLRAARRAAPGQPAGDPGPRPGEERPAGRARAQPVDGPLGRPGPG